MFGLFLMHHLQQLLLLIGVEHPLFAQPRHPYTGGLLASIPRLDAPRGDPLEPIPGSPNDTIPWSQGCAFEPRSARLSDRAIVAAAAVSQLAIRSPAFGR